MAEVFGGQYLKKNIAKNNFRHGCPLPQRKIVGLNKDTTAGMTQINRSV